jgi:hypothetical protein
MTRSDRLRLGSALVEHAVAGRIGLSEAVGARRQKPPASAVSGDEFLARAEGPGLRRRGREGPACRGSLGPGVAALEQETGVRR